MSGLFQVLFGIGVDGTSTGFLCGVEGGYLYFDTGGGHFKLSGVNYVADNQWHHFAVAYDEGTKTIKLYLDGENIYTNTGDIDTQNAPLLIGKSFAYPFNGSVTGVNLYNKSLSSNEINTIYNVGVESTNGSPVRNNLTYEYILSTGNAIDTAGGHAIKTNGNIIYNKPFYIIKDISNNNHDITENVDKFEYENIDGLECAKFTGSGYLATDNIGEEYTGTKSKTLMAWFRTNVNSPTISGFVRNRGRRRCGWISMWSKK